MKKALWASLVLAVLLLTVAFTGCSGGPGFKKAASGTIGAAGGELKSGDDIAVTVPAGALAADAEVVVSVNMEEKAMGAGQASPVYEIKGLGDFTKPVTLKIKTTKPLTGETMVLASIRNVSMDEGNSIPEFHFYPCTVGEGFVEVTIDPSGKTTVMGRILDKLFGWMGTSYAITSDEKMMAAAVMTDLKKAEPVKEFRIVAASGVTAEQVKTIEGYCTDAVNTVKGLGFDISKYSGYPIEVQVRGLNWLEWDSGKAKDEQAAGLFWKVPGIRGWIVINKDLLNNTKDIKTTILHEFFHAVQSGYGVSNLWLCEATATWIEENVDKGIPANYSAHGENSLQIFNPLDLQGRSEAQHGYGSASIIKYGTSIWGSAKIVEMFNNQSVYNSAQDVMEGFGPINGWINDFYLKLIQKQVYGGTQLVVTRLKNDAEKVSVPVKGKAAGGEDSDTDEGVTKHSVTIPAYGAKFVLVEMKADDPTKVNDSASLTARSATENVTLNIMKVVPGSTQPFTGKKTATANGIKQILTGKGFVLVMVTNTTDASVTEELEFEVTLAPPLEELVGDWTTGKATFSSVYLHPEIMKLANQEVPTVSPDSENPLEGCDAAMGQAIIGVFKQLKELEGKTVPSKQRIEQTGPETGTIYNAHQMPGEDMGDFDQGFPFNYKDGLLTSNSKQAQGEDGTMAVQHNLTAVYDKKTKEIVMSGTILLELYGEGGVKALGFTMNVEYRKPIPEGAFAASLPQS